ncbi:sigma-54 interaction domain-containing protein [Desulfopila inferna]|uniref:sigma-54 interaction domain-containing protein n=1 Tax=Desulfopila inferna TaxID=468528 RepID=UPI001965ECC5|nr:sigma 54-interacting transcriptional regulator [Desulfopila inferna]MBM9603542.1 sigma 54-interacting transcriptional regulator [Desulfopila inferna]
MDTSKDLTGAATRIILDSISDGVFTVDHHFFITSFNSAAEKITGFTKKDAIGRNCREIFRSNMCTGACALKKTMEEQRGFVNSSTTITNRQGKSIPISVSTSLLKDNKGRVLGGVETFRDLSIVEGLRRELEGIVKVGRMFSRNREMKQIFSIVQQVGESEATVLIEGETGTGKELLSRAIHSYSLRQDKRFVAINCGALPDTLLESELFGYKAGAFTGATHDKEGLFGSAGRGTVLLDEIGDTSPAFQVKLLRLLEEKEFQPLGSVRTRKTEARIIAATNKNLAEMVEQETFRQDLYYRINVIHLKLPPLHDRAEDIPLLLERFIERMNSVKGYNVTAMSPEALEILMSHNYPGNIRELENIVEHAFVLCRKDMIQPHHLPPSLTRRASPTRQNSQSSFADNSILSAVQATEREIIDAALKANNYNRRAASKQLGMHTSTLYRKMQKLHIRLPEVDGRSTRLTSSSYISL